MPGAKADGHGVSKTKPSFPQNRSGCCELPVANGPWSMLIPEPYRGTFWCLLAWRKFSDISDTLTVLSAEFPCPGRLSGSV